MVVFVNLRLGPILVDITIDIIISVLENRICLQCLVCRRVDLLAVFQINNVTNSVDDFIDQCVVENNLANTPISLKPYLYRIKLG